VLGKDKLKNQQLAYFFLGLSLLSKREACQTNGFSRLSIDRSGKASANSNHFSDGLC